MEKNNWREYFLFTRKERIAVLIMLSCIGFVAVLPLFLEDTSKIKGPEPVSAEEFQKLQSFYRSSNADTGYDIRENYSAGRHNGSKAPGSLFAFDPNTITDADWLRLGISERTVKTIRKYLSKGGRFRTSEDIQRIYGIQPTQAERLMPYVRIVSSVSKMVPAPGRENSLPAPNMRIKERVILDINKADSMDFLALPGIGEKLAGRIIQFRQKLGGFYAVDQLAQVYGLQDSVFQKLLPRLACQPSDVQKININTASADQLKQHPLIRWKLAQTLVAFRQQHGVFKSTEDLRKLQLMDENTLTKLLPYLVVE